MAATATLISVECSQRSSATTGRGSSATRAGDAPPAASASPDASAAPDASASSGASAAPGPLGTSQLPAGPAAWPSAGPLTERAVPGLPTADGPPALGFSAGELTELGATELNARLSALAATGATWVRFDVAWPTVQPHGPAEWDWTAADRVVSAAAAHGLHSLPILGYTPAWARADGCGDLRCPPARPADFARFAATAVGRYQGSGVGVWEIWNEPNLASSWAPAPDATAYADLLRATTAAIRATGVPATVLTGGLGPAQTAPGEVHPAEFLDRVYSVAGAQAFDGVGMHPYSFPALPSDTSQTWSGWSQLRQVRDLMVAKGDAAKSIWITEFGAPTAGPGALATLADRKYAAHPDHVDESLQRQSAVDGFDQAIATPWVQGFFWYNFKDLGTDPANTEDHYGVVRRDDSQKPAYTALRDAFQGSLLRPGRMPSPVATTSS